MALTASVKTGWVTKIRDDTRGKKLEVRDKIPFVSCILSLASCVLHLVFIINIRNIYNNTPFMEWSIRFVRWYPHGFNP